MNANDLIRRSMAKHNEKVSSDSIEYHHVAIDIRENSKCFVSNREMKDEKGGVKRIETVFSQVYLEYEPEEVDMIEYDGASYRVTRWEKEHGYYLIFAETRRRHTGQRMRHQTRGRSTR